MFLFSFPRCCHQGAGEAGGSEEMETDSEMAEVSWVLLSFNPCPIPVLDTCGVQDYPEASSSPPLPVATDAQHSGQPVSEPCCSANIREQRGGAPVWPQG